MAVARQSRTPVQFGRTTRGDRAVGITSGRAGVSLPLDYIPLLRGDSCAGSFSATFDLAEMPKPLLNAVTVNVQAWFVPKSAFPQFSGYDEFMSSYHGEQIKALGQPDRNPPEFFTVSTGPDADLMNSTFLKTLGIHLQNGTAVNTDVVDAYNLIWNFRAAAHSSKLPLRDYAAQDMANAVEFAPAFWPSSRFRHIVPDYERALVVGQLDLDVAAGQMPVANLHVMNGVGYGSQGYDSDGNATPASSNSWAPLGVELDTPNDLDGGFTEIYAELGGQTVGTSLADIDKARTAQAFAKLRTALAGNDATGFDNDDAIVAELMQGFAVPEDMFKRPWLLDSQRAVFGMVERHATDAANLDQSVSIGRAQVNLSLNVPQNEVGGIILITAEVLPEQLHERQGDDFWRIDSVAELPNALRDVQRPEPVDLVDNYRIDARHTSPDALYGYEPMNARWDRDFTRCGGVFYEDTPGASQTESRAGIWQADVVDPNFNEDHYLAPSPFPHDVFADTLADAVEISYRHAVSIRGLTQIGDVLAENNDDYAAVAAEQA